MRFPFRKSDRDGTGDSDNDRVTDIQEYLDATDPSASNAPAVPVTAAPADGGEVNSRMPLLEIENSPDPDGDTVTYEFEVYADAAMTIWIAGETHVAETETRTSWTVPEELGDNTWHHWRVRSSDGKGFSSWTSGRFFVNTENDPPGAFYISTPAYLADVDNRMPVLEVTNSTDPDEEVLEYYFEIYSDQEMKVPVTHSPDLPPGESGNTSWTVNVTLDDNTWYFWRAVAMDEHGAWTETELASFFVNTANDAPSSPAVKNPGNGAWVDTLSPELELYESSDPDNDALIYHFEIYRDSSLTDLICSAASNTSKWTVTPALENNTWYYWRPKSEDEHGGLSG